MNLRTIKYVVPLRLNANTYHKFSKNLFKIKNAAVEQKISI